MTMAYKIVGRALQMRLAVVSDTVRAQRPMTAVASEKLAILAIGPCRAMPLKMRRRAFGQRFTTCADLGGAFGAY